MAKTKFPSEQCQTAAQSLSTIVSVSTNETKAAKRKRKQRKKESTTTSDQDNTNKMDDPDRSKISKAEREVMLWRRELNIVPSSLIPYSSKNNSKNNIGQQSSDMMKGGCEMGGSEYGSGQGQHKHSPQVVVYENPSKRKKVCFLFPLEAIHENI